MSYPIEKPNNAMQSTSSIQKYTGRPAAGPTPKRINYQAGKLGGTDYGAGVLQQLIGFDINQLGNMQLEDVQAISAQLDNIKEQGRFAKETVKKLREILKQVTSIEQLRAEILKEGLEKEVEINSLLSNLAIASGKAQHDNNALSAKTKGELNMQQAQFATDMGVHKESLTLRLKSLRAGGQQQIQSMRENHRQSASDQRERIAASQQRSFAQRQYNQTLNDAMNNKVSASQARGIMGRLKAALTY